MILTSITMNYWTFKNINIFINDKVTTEHCLVLYTCLITLSCTTNVKKKLNMLDVTFEVKKKFNVILIVKWLVFIQLMANI